MKKSCGLVITVVLVVVCFVIGYLFIPVNVPLKMVCQVEIPMGTISWWVDVEGLNRDLQNEIYEKLSPIDYDYKYIVSNGRPLKSLTYQRISKYILAYHYYKNNYLANVKYVPGKIEKKAYVYQIKNVPLIDRDFTDF